MPRATANVAPQINQNGTTIVDKHPGKSSSRLASREQTRYYPYSQSMVKRGQLGLPTHFIVGSQGRKEYPDWTFRGSEFGDVELISSDGVSFWVPPYVLMAFSDELLQRIQKEQACMEATNQSVSGRSSAVGLATRHIVIKLMKTHHRVLAAFLAFTQGRLDLVEMNTAAQYWQCYDFAHAYKAKHLKRFLVESLWAKVVKKDPMGSFAFACSTQNETLMKTCFLNMGDHWCITVDVETGVAVWSSFERGTYSVDNPVRCADAFASKIGLDKFRAFMSACDMALDTAAANSKNANHDVAEQGHQSLGGKLESGGEYYIFDGPDLWEMIYRQTMAYAVFNQNESDVVAWIDDAGEYRSSSSTVPLTPGRVAETRKSVPGSRNSDGLAMDPNEQDPSDEERQFLLESEADRARGISDDDEEMARENSDVDDRYV